MTSIEPMSKSISVPMSNSVSVPMPDSLPARKPRIYYLDKLRLFLTAVVVVHHCFWVVVAGWFPFFRPWNNDVPTLVIGFIFLTSNQGYFMGLFFFISGLVTIPSLKRKGTLLFLKDRFIRLVLPAILYELLFFPLLFCFLQAGWYNPKKDFFNSKSFEGLDEGALFKSGASFAEVWSFYYNQTLPVRIFNGNQMWFTVTLFFLNFLAVLLFTFVQPLNKMYLKATPNQHVPKRSLKGILIFLILFSFLLYIINFLLRITYSSVDPWYPIIGNIAYIGQYVVAFTAGILANHGNFLDCIQKSHLKVCLSLSLIFFFFAQTCYTFAVNPMREGLGNYGYKAVATFFEQFFAVFWSYTLLTSFKSFQNSEPSKMVAKLIGAAYSTYIVHQWIVIPIAVGFAYFDIHPLLVIFLLCVTANPLSWISGLLLKAIPGSDIIL